MDGGQSQDPCGAGPPMICMQSGRCDWVFALSYALVSFSVASSRRLREWCYLRGFVMRACVFYKIYEGGRE
jgi:hypothetical protein